MGDVRFTAPFERVARAENPREAMRVMQDEDVIAALAGATRKADAYLVNVLASEAMNRARRKGTIVETAVEGLVSLDERGDVTFMNPAAERLLGWSLDDLRGACFHDVVHVPPDVGAPSTLDECPVFDVTRTCRVLTGHETTFTRRDGRTIPVSVTAAAIVRDGVVQGLVETFTDISGRKQAEASLRESEARKRAILAAAPDAIITMDDESRIVEWNPAAERIFGWSATEIVGEDMTDRIIPYRYRTAHKVGLSRYLATGEAAVLNERIELPGLRKDGTEFPTEITIVPIESTSGRLFTGWLRDIGREKRLEAERRESETRYRLLFRSIREPILVADRERVILDCNEAFEELTGYACEDVKHGSTAFLYAGRDEYERVGRALRERFGGDGFSEEATWKRKDGTEIRVRIAMSYMKDDSQNVAGFIGFVRPLAENAPDGEAGGRDQSR